MNARERLMIQDKEIINFDFELVEKDLLCKVIATGEIDFFESVSAMKYVANHPDFKPNYKVLVDLTEMNYHPSYDDLLGIVDSLKLMKDAFRNKIALVTQKKMSIVAKLVTIYCELAGMKMKSFTNFDDAYSWILKRGK